jgi:hypothetical protein
MKLIKNLQHCWQLAFGAAKYYYESRTGDEAAFWYAKPSNRGLLLDAENWPGGQGRRYVAKMILIRWVVGIVLPYVFYAAICVAILAGVILAAKSGGRSLC